MRASQQKNSYSDEHPHTGSKKGPLPAKDYLKRSTEEVADKGTYIDAHVKDVVALVLAAAVLIGVVEITEQGGDVGFEKSVAQNHQAHGQIQHRQGMNAHQHIANPHQYSAKDDRAAVAHVTVGQQSAEERCEKNQGNEGAVKIRSFFLCEGKTGFHILEVKGENADHEIVAEALPHFGEKQVGQRLRMVFPHEVNDLLEWLS